MFMGVTSNPLYNIYQAIKRLTIKMMSLFLYVEENREYLLSDVLINIASCGIIAVHCFV